MSGRSPLTLALRVGDHMMFVQLQLAAQHAPLQHRHVLAAAAAAAAAARGDPSATAPVSSPCRPVSGAARVPPMSSSPAPASPSPVTAGSFRSHSASATCPEVSPGKKAHSRTFPGLGEARGSEAPMCALDKRPAPDSGLQGLSLPPTAYLPPSPRPADGLFTPCQRWCQPDFHPRGEPRLPLPQTRRRH